MPVVGSLGVHDVGGVRKDDGAPLDLEEKPYALWERNTHALLGILVKKGLCSLDEHRRAVESLSPEQYESQSYYQRWVSGIIAVSIERGTFSKADLDQELGDSSPDTTIRFQAGSLVRVRDESSAIRWRKPHLRTPGYIFGLVGHVERDCTGLYADPEALAFAEAAVRQPLYRVRFFQRDVWEGYAGSDMDSIDVEIYQAWLQPASEEELSRQRQRSSHLHAGLLKGMVEHKPTQQQGPEAGQSHSHADHHDHDAAHAAGPAPGHGQHHHHDHGHDDHHGPHDGQGHEHGSEGHEDHVHEGRSTVEQKAVELEGDDSAKRHLAEALLRLLARKGAVTQEEIRRGLEVLDSRGQQGGGARLVARAWVDPAFKQRLLQDGNAAAAELGLEGSNWPPRKDVPAECAPKEKYGTVLTVVENTAAVHNLIVCTLCSCYPMSILGMSPSWYKSRAYRSRAVRDPRGVLAEFGLSIPPEVAVRVHDSTADYRYLVLPERPAGTEGWDEAQLAQLVCRDAMIGVARALMPQQLQQVA